MLLGLEVEINLHQQQFAVKIVLDSYEQS